jgi:hypothetical protein
MSRKSVIQLVPAPVNRGNASDLRYRLLLAALGSSEEVNPLLIVADSADGADETLETVACPPDDANRTIAPTEPHAVEHIAVAEHENQATPPSSMQPPAPHKTATRATGGVPLPQPSKRR